MKTIVRWDHLSEFGIIPLNQKAANSYCLVVFAGVRPRQAGLLFFFAANS